MTIAALSTRSTFSKLALPPIPEVRKYLLSRPGSTLRRSGAVVECRRNLRGLEAEGKAIRGYAAVFDQVSEDLGWFCEKIAPTAFDKDLSSGADVRAFAHHMSWMPLGRVVGKTLRLWKDSIGLGCEISISDAGYARDLQIAITRGDVNQMSFGFIVRENGDTFDKTIVPGTEDKWAYLRTLLDVELIEVSPVSIPAYSGTSCGIVDLGGDALELGRSLRDRKIKLLSLRHR